MAARRLTRLQPPPPPLSCALLKTRLRASHIPARHASVVGCWSVLCLLMPAGLGQTPPGNSCFSQTLSMLQSKKVTSLTTEVTGEISQPVKCRAGSHSALESVCPITPWRRGRSARYGAAVFREEWHWTDAVLRKRACGCYP